MAQRSASCVQTRGTEGDEQLWQTVLAWRDLILVHRLRQCTCWGQTAGCRVGLLRRSETARMRLQRWQRGGGGQLRQPLRVAWGEKRVWSSLSRESKSERGCRREREGDEQTAASSNSPLFARFDRQRTDRISNRAERHGTGPSPRHSAVLTFSLVDPTFHVPSRRKSCAAKCERGDPQFALSLVAWSQYSKRRTSCVRDDPWFTFPTLHKEPVDSKGVQHTLESANRTRALSFSSSSSSQSMRDKLS